MAAQFAEQRKDSGSGRFRFSGKNLRRPRDLERLYLLSNPLTTQEGFVNILPMKKLFLLAFIVLFAAGCETVGLKKREVPAEFHQKIILEASDKYYQHQAPRSGYDAGDLQAFHTQHTFPAVVQEAFEEIFSEVELHENPEEEAKVEGEEPDVPAVFEVRLIDLANDNYTEADDYRAEVTIAVAAKSPRGNIFWQKAFRGEGYVKVDPQFSTGLGPQDAVVDAVRDALGQMQDAIVKEPQVRLLLRHYQEINEARKGKEVQV